MLYCSGFSLILVTCMVLVISLARTDARPQPSQYNGENQEPSDRWSLGFSYLNRVRGVPSNKAPSLRTRVKPRVKGGRDTTERSFLARIEKGGKRCCSGIIVHREWILTLRKCIDERYLDSYKIYIKPDDYSDTKEELKFKCATVEIPHKTDKDIVLVKLNGKIDPDRLQLKFPRQPNTKNEDYSLSNCYLVGLYKDKGRDEFHQHVVPVKLLRDKDCPRATSKKNVCFESKDGKVCPGDSGSPLLCMKERKLYLRGLYSAGSTCKRDRLHAVQMSYFADDIVKAIGRHNDGEETEDGSKSGGNGEDNNGKNTGDGDNTGDNKGGNGSGKNTGDGDNNSTDIVIPPFGGGNGGSVTGEEDTVCEKAIDIANGQALLEDENNSKVGAIAIVICEEGYTAKKDFIMCLESGKWETSKCTKKVCEETVNIANGRAVLDNDNKRKVGATATVVCDNGYTTEKKSITCLKSGKWDISSCSRIVCEKTVDIANGRVVLDDGNNIELGATATVICDEGYTTKNESIMCLESGEWEISNCSKIDNKVLACDFEILGDKSCRYESVGKTRYAWTRNNGQTDTWHTGPTADHTVGGYWGHYLYLESNAPADYQDIAKLYFDPITGAQDYCLTLWYHMYGSHIEYISVGLEDTVTNGMTEIIRVSGDQGNTWYPAAFKITADNVPNDFRIVIEAQRGRGIKSDYAVDDLVVTKGSCADCGSVPGVENGKVKLVDPSNSEAGAEASVSCNLGYGAEREKIKCLVNGDWETPVCSINDCGSVPGVANGKASLDDPSNSEVGAEAKVKCNLGYGAEKERIKCLVNGEWEAPICSINDCGSVPDVVNGNVRLVDPSNSEVGAEAKVKCNLGYGAEKERIKCLIDGEWETPMCSINDCGAVPDVANGKAKLVDPSNSEAGAKAKVNCNFGYRAERERIKCLVNGEWETPACSINVCDKTADIANGHAVLDNKSNRMVGATATVVCEYGYTTKKESITCLKSGEWETSSCSKIVCEKTFDIANGRAVLDDGNNIELGAAATVICDEGYTTKNKSIMCLESGEWEISNCSKIDDKVLACDFEILDDRSCKYETIGKARYAWSRNNGQTKTWYTGPTADHTRGKYWGHYLYLESNAPADYQDIAKLRFDPITGSQDYCFTLWYHMYGSHIDYMSISLEDTVTNGMTEIIRISGDQGNTWYPAAFKITADNVPNDFMIVIEAQRGQGVKSDYAVDDLIVSKGSCADCGSVPDVANGKVRLADPSNSEVGAEAKVNCNLGYGAEKERIKCLVNGEWETPMCSINDCGSIPDVANGKVRLADPSNSEVGAEAKVNCNLGYGAEKERIKCLVNGEWETPMCSINDCGSIPDVANGKVRLADPSNSEVGAEAKVNCNLGYGAEKERIKCLVNGEWETPMCSINDCGAVPVVANGKAELVDPSNSEAGAKAKVNCNFGYKAERERIKCSINGEWETPVCSINVCNKTADIANGHAVLDNKSNRKVGATATVVCEYGYTTKKESIMCFKSGEWEIASCSRIVCEQTFDIANGRAVLDESNNIELGATATVTCDEGYKTKNKSIMCLESGEWEISNCSKINNKVLDCDFEILDDKSCKYETIGKARYAWTRNNGQTNTWYTGPTADHTRGKYWGHYLYLESNAPADYQDIAKLRFDPITGSEDYCFTLWYHMYGSHIDYMSISLEDTVTNGMTEIIRVSGDQGNKWHPAGFKITADNVPNDFMIVIEAQRGQGVKSDYAIDDLIVSKGSCADCGFVPGVANGKVRLVDPSNSEAGAEATVSCKLGYRAETERIKCLINGEWETPVCSVNDCGQVPIVENGNIVLDDPSSTTVGATASVSCNYGYEPRAKSIRCLRKGLWEEPNCKKTVCTTRPNVRNGRAVLDDPTNVYVDATATIVCSLGMEAEDKSITCLENGKWEPAGCSKKDNVVIACDFEEQDQKNLCQWHSVGKARYSWTRHNGETGTWFTGPDADHSIGDYWGHYVYLEANAPAEHQDVAQFVLPSFTGNQEYCFQFWYHMYGSQIVYMSVYLQDLTTKVTTEMTRILGNQRNSWHQATFNITSDVVQNDFSIGIESERGLGTKGDYAIDDLIVTKGLCKGSQEH